MTSFQQALCCTCGTVRECRRARNHRGENYWLSDPVDPDWHRETGDLKCAECGCVTRHALVTNSDYDENLHRVATGWDIGFPKPEKVARVQRLWRVGVPQNPYLNHRWFTSTETAARQAGKTHFQALCMAQVPMPEVPSERRRTAHRDDGPVKPQAFHDVDREDPDTGLWWFDNDCVDCLSRANAILSDRRRDALRARLQAIVDRISKLDSQTVLSLLAQFDDADSSGAQG